MDRKTETSWSECYQDLGSWCRLPLDELNTPVAASQSEYKFSFDDQSMYNPLDNQSTVDLKGEMWKDDSELFSLPYNSEVDNNNSLTMPEILPESPNISDTSTIKYSCNLFLSSDLEQTDRLMRPNTQMPTSNTPFPHHSLVNMKKTNIPSKETNIIVKPKPSLKLDISVANTKEQVASDLETLDITTPDVFNLTNDSSFNILSYVEGSDDPSYNLIDPNNIVLPRPKETLATPQVIKIDHDYIETQHLRQQVTPLSEDIVKNELLEIDNNISPFVDVKEEPSSPSTSNTLGKRERKKTEDEDFDYGGDSPSDQSMDWTPLSKKSRKAVKKKTGEGSRIRTSSMSDSGSVTSGPDKYRELRDRNNEASRRSRMNRKRKEVEMTEEATLLAQKNVYLKSKAESYEKRVKMLRQILLKVVLEKNNKNAVTTEH